MSQYQQAPITQRNSGLTWKWKEPSDPSDPESQPTLVMILRRPSDTAIARYEAFGEKVRGWPPGHGGIPSYEEWKARKNGK